MGLLWCLGLNFSLPRGVSCEYKAQFHCIRHNHYTDQIEIEDKNERKSWKVWKEGLGPDRTRKCWRGADICMKSQSSPQHCTTSTKLLLHRITLLLHLIWINILLQLYKYVYCTYMYRRPNHPTTKTLFWPHVHKGPAIFVRKVY